MTERGQIAVLAFYDNHPISEAQILEKMERDGVGSDAITEDVLQNYDQDHFGGVAANDALARAASIGPDTEVLDVCCGLGGPSRYLSHNFGCRVVGIDLTESRIKGARKLTKMSGLEAQVSFEVGNALDLPVPDSAYDVVISQEAFCHVPEKRKLVSECVRVLRPGGHIAFTDIMATGTTTEEVRNRLSDEMTFNELISKDQYQSFLVQAGCRIVSCDDLSETWRDILVKRLEMYRGLKGQTIERFGQAHFDNWDRAYSFFVGRYQTGELGGARIVAQKL